MNMKEQMLRMPQPTTIINNSNNGKGGGTSGKGLHSGKARQESFASPLPGRTKAVSIKNVGGGVS